MKISMKLVYEYMTIFFTFSPTSNHIHPLQVENCDSNSRLVVDEDDYGKVRLERVNLLLSLWIMFTVYLINKLTPAWSRRVFSNSTELEKTLDLFILLAFIHSKLVFQFNIDIFCVR